MQQGQSGLVTQHHEAPASVNLKGLLYGHEVMVTLRGENEATLLGRLEALLRRPEIRPIPSQPRGRTAGLGGASSRKPSPSGIWGYGTQKAGNLWTTGTRPRSADPFYP